MCWTKQVSSDYRAGTQFCTNSAPLHDGRTGQDIAANIGWHLHAAPAQNEHIPDT
jgi:hypothetical protein